MSPLRAGGQHSYILHVGITQIATDIPITNSLDSHPPDRENMFDLLIKGATIVDGTGAKTWVGDAAIAGDRLAALDHHIQGEARRVIAADGYMLTPGFIDIHCHSDFSLFDHPDAEIELRGHSKIISHFHAIKV
jgi:adenine deaminase